MIRDIVDLDRATLARLGREWMLFGHLYDRALMPQVALRVGVDEIVPLAIAEWMGASPVYTRRMRRLMGITGDGVSAICKALQLDVGFAHEYMDVAYRIHDETSAEFWLNHCGALMDVEPQGPEMVVNMCHHIEDPTFDATAVATNPRARIRPLHRPPRRPADRHPHCHWTLRIDPDTEPLARDPHTDRVAALPLAGVPNEVPADREPGGRRDYAGPFDPSFRLEQLSWGALVAVLREFSVQCHLLSASAGLFLTDRHGAELTATIQRDQLEGASWVTAERIAALLHGHVPAPADADARCARVLDVLACHPALGPFVDREVSTTAGGGAELTLRSPALDPDAPGWVGLLARGAPDPVTAAATAVAPGSEVTATVDRGTVRYRLRVPADGGRGAAVPDSVALTRLSTAATWTFRPSPALTPTRPPDA